MSDTQDNETTCDDIEALKVVLQDIGHLAVWSVSSAKSECGVQFLFDDNIDSFWQSDGKVFPHSVSLQFPKKISIISVAIYLNYDVDETYTPQILSIRSGTVHNDLYEVKSCELTDPIGWTCIKFDDGHLRTNFLQISVISNFMNGRDTRIRLIKIFGPRSDITKYHSHPNTDNYSVYNYLK